MMASSRSTSENVLHPECCEETEADFARMRQCLKSQPTSLEEHCTVFTSGYYSKHKYSPLQSAIICDHFKCAEFLLQNGALVKDNNTSNPLLERAILVKDVIFLELILKQGGNPDYDPSEKEHLKEFRYFRSLGNTYLIHLAVKNGDPASLRLLLAYGASTEEFVAPERAEPPPPVVLATWEGQPECLKLLLLYGASIEPTCSEPANPDMYDSQMPLFHLINPYHSNKLELELLHILYSFGVNLYLKNSQGFTALQLFEINSNYVMPQLLPLFKTDAELWLHMKRYKDIAEVLRQLMNEPCSLQDLSRLALKHVLGRKYLAALPDLRFRNLPLPLPISHFLHY